MMYPPVDDTIEILVAAARAAAKSNNLQHPEDIASAMITAIEASWVAVDKAWRAWNEG